MNVDAGEPVSINTLNRTGKEFRGIDAQSFINVIFKIITYSAKDERLTEILELTAQRFALAEISVGVFDDIDECLRVSYGWISQDSAATCQPKDRSIPYDELPSTLELLRKGRISSYSADTDEAHPDVVFFQKNGFKANLMYPIFVHDAVFGYLSLSKRESWRWTEADKGIFATVSYIVESIMLRQEMEKEVRGANTLMNFVLQNSPAAIAVFDSARAGLIYANSSFRELHGISDYTNKIAWGDEHSDRGLEQEVYLPDEDRWLKIYHNHAKWIDGRDVVICSVNDVTTAKKQAEKIEQLAFFDPLLGIFNRTRFEMDLPLYLKSDRGALIFIDLDNFKSINDSYSHAHGDNLLKEIAAFCRTLPLPHGNIYRYGGDEFVIIADQASLENAESICSMIIERCKKPWNIGNGILCYCTASLGVACYPDDADTPEEIIKSADIAVFRAKAEGKNTAARFTAKMSADFLDQALLERGMRKSINEDMEGFEICYQPIMGRGNKCIGAEAVLFWKVPELGRLKQADFIPLAEYLGLIDHIGNWLLDKSCRQCKLWNNSFDAEFFISVFMSNKQMRAGNFVDSVHEILRKYSLTPKNLVLEVTEAEKERDTLFSQKLVSALNAIGVTIAISGFGSSFISFLNLRNMGIDIVKIGPELVKTIDRDPFVRGFLRSIFKLLHSLSKRVCVKGIDTREQLTVLREAKVDFFQGYYFSQAEDSSVFERKYLFGKASKRKDAE